MRDLKRILLQEAHNIRGETIISMEC